MSTVNEEFEHVNVTGQMRGDLRKHGPGHVLIQTKEKGDPPRFSVTVRTVEVANATPNSRVLMQYEDLSAEE